MHHSTRFSAAVVAGAFALAACGKKDQAADSAAAATPTADSTAAMTTPPAPDSAAATTSSLSAANVASMISLTNAGEVGAAKVAQEKGTNADVKAFAKMMISDHEAMQKSLDSLAKAKSLTPEAPAAADQQRQADSQVMATLNGTAKGAAFDKAYIDAQVQAHQKALNDLNGFAGSTSDADLKALIQQAIPKVQAHLDRAQQIQQKLGT